MVAGPGAVPEAGESNRAILTTETYFRSSCVDPCCRIGGRAGADLLPFDGAALLENLDYRAVDSAVKNSRDTVCHRSRAPGGIGRVNVPCPCATRFDRE